MSDTPRTSEEWQRLQRLPNGLYSPKVTTMDLAIGMNRFAGALERECDGLRKAYDIALRQMNDAIASKEWYRTDAIVDLEKKCADLRQEVLDYERRHQNKKCEWRPDEDGIYETGCAHLHEFMTDTLHENKYQFCPYCRGVIEDVEYEESLN